MATDDRREQELRERVDELESRLDGLTTDGEVATDAQGREWTLADLMNLGLTRRQALSVLVTLAGSSITLFAAIQETIGTAQAVGTSEVGQFGEPGRPLDGYVEDLYDTNDNAVLEFQGDGSIKSVSTEVVGTNHAMLSTYYDGIGTTTSTTETSIFNNSFTTPIILSGLPSGWNWEVGYIVGMSNTTTGESCTSKPQIHTYSGSTKTALNFNGLVLEGAEFTVTNTSQFDFGWSGWVDPGWGSPPDLVTFRELKAKVSGGEGQFAYPGLAFRAVEQ